MGKKHGRGKNSGVSTGVPEAGPHVTSHFQENEAELLYVEQMVPNEGNRPNIYWSACNFFLGERGGYAGIQHQSDEIKNGVCFKYNNICSLWDLEEKEQHLPTEVELTHSIEGVFWKHFGGEGTGLHTSHPMPWYPDQWYATVIRRWYVPGESVTRVAMFMYSYIEEKWTLYISVAVPGADIPITGRDCTGFLERFTGTELGYHGVYGQHFRMQKDGLWEKPLYYTASAEGKPNYWKAELYQGIGIKLTVGGCFDNTSNHHTFRPNQSDDKPKPAMLTPKVVTVNANYDEERNVISVDWSIARDRPPQLSYCINVYKNDLFQGEIVGTNAEHAPEKSSTCFKPLRILEPGTYWTSFEFTDIFNQTSNVCSNLFIVA